MNINKITTVIGFLILIALASIGWIVLFVQNPIILAKARWRYQRAVWQKINLSAGPCLGKIADDWVLDIAHLPRQDSDNLPENQCEDYRTNKVHHFVEMSPRGEIIKVN